MGGASIKREETDDGENDKAGGAGQGLANLQQAFLNGQAVVVALEGKQIKKVKGSWLCRW